MLKHLHIPAVFISSCLYQSFRHPLSKTVTCTFVNPGIVTTYTLPWVISGSLLVIGLVGVGVGEFCSLPNFTLYASNMFTAGLTYIGGMTTQAMQKRKE